jgi:hypothetical protein
MILIDEPGTKLLGETNKSKLVEFLNKLFKDLHIEPFNMLSNITFS